jgi:FixJ family two-component response regulator
MGELKMYVVEDDSDVRASLVALLTMLGHMTCCFESAEEFLETFHPNDEGCVISDIQLPGLSGIDLLAHLRNRGIEIPAILVTAHPDAPTIDRAMKVGAAMVLEKPFRANAMEHAIQTILGTVR